DKTLSCMQPLLKQQWFNSAIDTAIELHTPYAPDLIALYIKHGALIDKTSIICNKFIAEFNYLNWECEKNCQKDQLYLALHGNLNSNFIPSPCIIS
ncbi:MAG: hypothetical protein ACK4PR_08335, partial [Gammaproteobacteria bacterium]